jgi:glycosyltransferase involved in cell wall biosynthesis
LLGKFGKLIYKIFSVFGIKTHAFYAENGVFFTNEDADDFYKKFHCKCKRFIATPSFDIIKSWKNNIASRQDIVYVGRIEQIQKNIKFLIKLSKYLNCNIHVYGIGPQHHLVESNPYKIIYHKGLSASDVKTIYQKYKYTILVSKFEGYAFVLSESLSNGVPIIVRDTFVSAKYIADNGNNGFLLLKKYNAKKCAKLINEIIENDTKYLDRCKNCISFQSKIDFKKSWIKIFNHFLQNH